MNQKHTFFILLFLGCLSSKTVTACDACGCSNSGSYYGLMPQSHKSIIGLRYQNLNFTTHVGSKVYETQEKFNITELYARFFPIKRMQVMAFVPYRFAVQHTTSGPKRQNGIGDATLLLNYNILNTFMDKESATGFNHTILIGGGIKAPTGKFDYNESDPTAVANPNFQSGTGSTDFILNVFYTVNKNQWGLSTKLSRKFNTTNANQYRFGNQWYGTVDLYKSFTLKGLSITPNVGIYAEKGALGVQDGRQVLETGGHLVNGTAGLSFFADKWTVGLNIQKPISQNLSAGFVQTHWRGMIQLGFLF